MVGSELCAPLILPFSVQIPISLGSGGVKVTPDNGNEITICMQKLKKLQLQENMNLLIKNWFTKILVAYNIVICQAQQSQSIARELVFLMALLMVRLFSLTLQSVKFTYDIYIYCISIFRSLQTSMDCYIIYSLTHSMTIVRDFFVPVELIYRVM